ncbi:flagellar basal body rod protein FlgB [Hippea alviniae]|uniref:flagellar basal body rod protein FlgB n=1 Tax=Hippea alviniae TaxID=1279027 RepID=UPI0003B30213|nr:flagellar basal body rod protein FlgB [Hippea alviniae]
MAFLGDSTFTYLKKALDIAVLRQDVIASNIANADTPNYKAKHIPFKDVLDIADSELKLKKTDPKHIDDSSGGMDYLIKPDKNDYITKNDKNNVKLDKELTDLAKNTLLVNALTAFEKYKFNEYRDVISASKNI